MEGTPDFLHFCRGSVKLTAVVEILKVVVLESVSKACQEGFVPDDKMELEEYTSDISPTITLGPDDQSAVRTGSLVGHLKYGTRDSDITNLSFPSPGLVPIKQVNRHYNRAIDDSPCYLVNEASENPKTLQWNDISKFWKSWFSVVTPTS